ncbi:hypothetical protein EVAR_78855_1 [Eumeta japonica]|uniref:Endonuclease/exonuclease/phosphatase domain-containing protein n=1 Tax=Eumeta variegata TaxID=151549 RepID=A0A4C1U2H4_EUMVA|nr:hypothetical protein EVAR_78855_1 [Eumeta japonica]
MEPSNEDPSILIGLALTRANEDAAVFASSYQKNYLNVHALNICKPLEERKEFWADVRDILMKCDRNEMVVILGDFNPPSQMGVQRDGYEEVLD